jgi:3-oxoacyl-[acyl-carrier-protein] synthase-1
VSGGAGVVEVVAVGARTPVGLTAESSAAAVRAGISRSREHPFIDARGEPVVVAADARIDGASEGRERLRPLLESVLDEVGGKLAAGGPHRGRCRVWLALPESRPGFSDRDAAFLVDAARARVSPTGSAVEVEIAGRGHAGAIRAIERTMEEHSRNDDLLSLVAGVDSYVHPDTFAWLERNRQFAQPGVRSGFIPGEGAGCLVLASAGLRSRLRLPRLAVVRGARTARETQLRGSENGSSGVGMSDAVAGAVAGLELPRDAVDALYADINGERYRSEEWGFVALRTPSVWRSLEYEAPADCWGDVGAAFGTLAGVLAVQSFSRGYARGPRAMVLAGSESGLRGAMLLQQPQVP